jgi:hypothetical protein
MHPEWYNVTAMSPTLFPFDLRGLLVLERRHVVCVKLLDTHRGLCRLAEYSSICDLLSIFTGWGSPTDCHHGGPIVVATLWRCRRSWGRTSIHTSTECREGSGFDVKSSSSLPSFPRDFHVPAPKLMPLWLGCKEDDSGNDESERSTSTPVE